MDKNLVYLVQTDTTVGFVCANSIKLANIKNRPKQQKTIKVVDCLKTLTNIARVPEKYKNFIRKSRRTTFVFPNKQSYRVIDKNSKHHSFIDKFNIMYSTSANNTGKGFDEDFALEKANVVVFEIDGFKELEPSKIYKIGKAKIKQLR